MKVDNGYMKPYLQPNSGVFLIQFVHNFIYDQQLRRFSLVQKNTNVISASGWCAETYFTDLPILFDS